MDVVEVMDEAELVELVLDRLDGGSVVASNVVTVSFISIILQNQYCKKKIELIIRASNVRSPCND